MAAQPLYGMTRIAAETRLSVPAIRYWAEMYGVLIGAERLSDGGWRFTDRALSFFSMLAAEACPGTAVSDDTPAAQQRDVREANDVATRLAELTTRTEHLSAHIEDLAEETKQLQLLLTRIIALLTSTPSAGPQEKTVRPWDPPHV